MRVLDENFAHQFMTSIISDGEAKQILRNSLRKRAVARRDSELKKATSERRAAIMVEIEREVEKELEKWAWSSMFGSGGIH